MTRRLSPNAKRSATPKVAGRIERSEVLRAAKADHLGYDKALLGTMGMIDQEEFREELRALMAESGMTTADFAAAAGISTVMATFMLQSRRRAGISMVMQLSLRFTRIRHFWARCLIRHGERIRQAGIELAR